MVNVAYYTMVLVTLAQLPFDWNSVNGRTVISVTLLAVLIVIGMSGGMDWLNDSGNRTTAFNLAAVIGIVVAFIVANVQEALGGGGTSAHPLTWVPKRSAR